jgi:FeS assembly SUF system protein
VGIFSFLTGQKDADAAEPEPTAPVREPAPAVAPAPPAASSGTPFTPPEAWNTDALTAPIPESSSAEKPDVGSPDPEQTAALQSKIVDVLKTVFDPEIPVDIYELGLIYDIIVDANSKVLVKMTLTSPACPSAQQIPSEARYKVKAVPGVTDAWVEIVWEPPWDKDRMSEAAKLQLGMF